MKKKDLQQSNEGLSDEQLDMLKSNIASQKTDRSKLPHYDNSEKARFFRFIKKNSVYAAICGILAVSAIAAIILGISFAMGRREKVNKDDFTFIIGDKEYTAKYKDTVKDGVIYVDMYKIAEYAELIITGSKTSVKFTSDDENYLRFENQAESAVINGSMVELGGVAEVGDGYCHIPYSFLTKAVGNGLRLTLDTDTNTIEIMRRMYATEDEDVFTPVEILFYTDSFNILMGIANIGDSYEYDYSIGISDFLPYIDPEDSQKHLVLANKDTPLGEDYVPSELTELTCPTASGRKMYLTKDAALSVYAMMLAMQTDGITDTYVTSAYRTYSYQVGLFEDYVSNEMKENPRLTREEAEQIALEYSARPGTSEHQTGLCVDFMTTSMTELDESFERTAAFSWLCENAHKYGFILRYPADKVSTTGYKYEPWHYRFVGRTAATEIYESSLCLEEYLTLN